MNRNVQAYLILASILVAVAIAVAWKPRVHVRTQFGGVCEPLRTPEHTLATTAGNGLETVCDDYCWSMVILDQLNEQVKRTERTLDEIIEAVDRRREQER